MLMIGRAITGIAAGTWVLLVVGFSGLFPPGENLRAAGLINMVNSIGMVIGSLSTGWLNGLGGYSLAFYLAIGVAGLAFLVMLPGKEIPRAPQKPSFSETKTLITRRDVLLPSLLGAVAQYTVWATVFSFIPILAKQFGASDVLQSLLQSLNLIVLLIGNVVLTVVVKKFKARHLLYFSFILMAVGLIFAALAQSLVLVLIAQFCNGLGLGIGFPILMGLSVENTSEHERSTAMGLFQAVYAIGMFTGPGISGFLASWLGIQPMFTFTAVVVLLVSIAGVRFLNVNT
jgi:MFS family permease